MSNAVILKHFGAGALSAPNGSAAGTSVSYLDNDYIGTIWRSTLTSGTDGIDIDFATARAIDTVLLLSNNGLATTQQPVAATSQAGLATPAYTGAAVSLAAGSAVMTSGRYNSYQDLGAPQTYRWWRIYLAGLSGAVEAGRLCMGTRFSPARNFSFGAAFGARDLGGMDFSRQGVPLETPGAVLRTIGLSFTSATRQEAEETLLPLLEVIGNRRFITVLTDPDANALRQRRMYHGPVSGNLEMLWRVPDGWEWRANLTSVI